MSKTRKQTDKIQEDRKSFCSDTEKIKHSKDYILEAMLDWACLHLRLTFFYIFRLTGWYSLIFYVRVAEKKMIIMHLQVQTFVMWSFWQAIHTNQLYDY